MNQEDRITSLFRNNYRRFEERPSPRAWQKLERKLDNRRRRRRASSVYRLFTLMAAAVALFLLVFALVKISDATPSVQVAQIEMVNGLDPQYIKEVSLEEKFRNLYKEQLNKSLEEGRAGRLVISNGENRPFLVPKKSS